MELLVKLKLHLEMALVYEIYNMLYVGTAKCSSFQE